MWWLSSSWSAVVFGALVLWSLHRIHRTLADILARLEWASTKNDAEPSLRHYDEGPSKPAPRPDPTAVDDGGAGVEALLRSRGLR